MDAPPLPPEQEVTGSNPVGLTTIPTFELCSCRPPRCRFCSLCSLSCGRLVATSGSNTVGRSAALLVPLTTREVNQKRVIAVIGRPESGKISIPDLPGVVDGPGPPRVRRCAPLLQ